MLARKIVLKTEKSSKEEKKGRVRKDEEERKKKKGRRRREEEKKKEICANRAYAVLAQLCGYIRNRSKTAREILAHLIYATLN